MCNMHLQRILILKHLKYISVTRVSRNICSMLFYLNV
nr:MAG TPA: hypothetical protein [Caudoviricetes sp.]